MHVLPILCVLLLLILQYNWFLQAFESTSKDMMEKCKTSLREAADIELIERTDVLADSKISLVKDTFVTDGEVIASGMASKTGDMIIFLYESSYLMGIKPDISKIDSIYKSIITNKIGFLPEYNISIKNDSVQLKNFQISGLISDSTKGRNTKKTTSEVSSNTNLVYDSIQGNHILIRLNSVQVIEMNLDLKSVIHYKEIRRLFFTSLFIVMFVILIIILQIRSLNKEHLKIQFLKEYTSAVTHDMQTPLNNIMYVSDMLKMGNFDKSEELRSKYYKLFKEQCEKQIRSIHRLLLLAKEERGELVLTKKFVKINEFVNEIICYYKESVSVQNKEVKFSFICNPENLQACIDKDKFEIVFYNMIDNSIKYSYESLNIDIECRQDNNNLNIKISDNGMGISAQDLDEIFKNFNRGSKVERSSIMGYGIGLSFVKKVVKAHKGDILVTSKEHVGTEFLIKIPIA